MKTPVDLRPSWACALAPWGFLILLASVILHLRLGLGRFPKPPWDVWDDYLTTAFRVHASIVLAAGWVSALVVPLVWLAMQAFPRLRAPTAVFLRQFAVFGLAWAVFFAFAVGDPWRLVSWYLDRRRGPGSSVKEGPGGTHEGGGDARGAAEFAEGKRRGPRASVVECASPLALLW